MEQSAKATERVKVVASAAKKIGILGSGLEYAPPLRPGAHLVLPASQAADSGERLEWMRALLAYEGTCASGLKGGSPPCDPLAPTKIHRQARAALCAATRQRRVPARRSVSFTGCRHGGRRFSQGAGTAVGEFHKGGHKGVWGSKLCHLHIDHLELEAVYKTAQWLLGERVRRVVRLPLDNRAVAAMLGHVMSWNAKLFPLSANSSAAQKRPPRRTRHRATSWGGVMVCSSRCQQIAPRHRRGLRGEHGTGPRPIDNALWPREAGGANAHGLQHMGDMAKGKCTVIRAANVSTWGAVLEEHRIIQSALPNLVVRTQGGSPAGHSVGRQASDLSIHAVLCGRGQVPACGHMATARLYIAHLISKETVKAASLRPYRTAINNYHGDMGHNKPVRIPTASRAAEGMPSLQCTPMGWLCFAHDWAEVELLLACLHVLFASVNWERPGTGLSTRRVHVAASADELSAAPRMEKSRRHAHLERRHTLPAAEVVGLVQLL
ncbi:hypothetical protein CYMTET_31182 [Cymbomonas tetramitiformis]|uniref:Uncharacterized protein n=1 Tax=Cymbomonas tetramitiformis TaxID=36881 RepID=A0AAE0FHM2_9CHLO|nr:hypothetical protein CYMTET_31182 [Cymbomonas tetramitiformis]